MTLVRKILRFGTISVLAVCVLLLSFLVGGKLGNSGAGKTSLITGVPFAEADAPAGAGAAGGSGGSSSTSSSSSSSD